MKAIFGSRRLLSGPLEHDAGNKWVGDLVTKYGFNVRGWDSNSGGTEVGVVLLLHRLSALKVLKITEPGHYADGDGLYLHLHLRFRMIERQWRNCLRRLVQRKGDGERCSIINASGGEVQSQYVLSAFPDGRASGGRAWGRL